MSSNKWINSVKFVVSLLVIVVFAALIINADKFYKWQEPVIVSSKFVRLWDDETTEIIDIDDIVSDAYDNERWVLQYIVQPGNTLGQIASMFGITVSHLQKINNLRSGIPIRPKQKLIITDEEKGFLYVIKEKTNIVVFANQYSLNAQDLMTLNYIQDETEILNEGQDLFINVDLEQAYKIWLKERPKVEIVPKVTRVAYTPTISKPSSSSSSNMTVIGTEVNPGTTSYTSTSTIIRQWVFKKPIKNRFYAGHCTWGVAVITPEIFPYIDEYTQARPFGGNGGDWGVNAKAAWFNVGTTPMVGSIAVYSKGWWWGGGAGHVGKVIAYYPDEGKMIIRDMNWKGKFIFTDRWEQVSNPNIKSYIYPPAEPWKPE